MIFMKTHTNMKNIVIKKQKIKLTSFLHIGKYMYIETNTRRGIGKM